MIYTGNVKKVEIYINSSYLRLTDIKAKTGCDLIFNGGIYDMSRFIPYCHLKVDGKVYTDDKDKYWGYGWNDKVSIVHSDKMSTVRNYIACVCLIKDGKPDGPYYNPSMDGARERTAWGIKADGTHVFYCDKSAKTPEALQAHMMAQGCDSALMLDGGGSTQGIFPNGEVYSSRIVHNVICVWLDKSTEDKPDNWIIEPSYKWKRPLIKRSKTDYIILHHAAANGSAEDVHAYHSSLDGWAGIGYNYYIRKDGKVYRGRPENAAGAHTVGYNDKSIGTCFEGNFQTEVMPGVQFLAGVKLIKDILSRHNVPIKKHGDFDNTACPGRNFPFNEIIEAVQGSTEPQGDFEGITLKLPMLRNGSKDKGVMTVQRLLIVMGYNPGVADGIFGGRTESAVKEFQRRSGLTADGVIGQQTWEKLIK